MQTILAAGWWRMSRYVVRNGRIAPAEGAELIHYNPLEWLEDRQAGDDSPGPHEQLANVDMNSEAAILSFVQRFGLLGTLPHRLEYVEFAGGVQFIRTNAGFGGQYSAAQVAPGAPRGAIPPGKAILATWLNDTKEIQEAGELFSRYFPGPLPPGGYPPILLPEFWATYSESLAEIREVIGHLRLAMWGLCRDGATREEFQFSRRWVLANAGAGLDIAHDGTGRILCRSLVSTLASLIWLDWSHGNRIQRCGRQTCSNLFVTNRSDKKYCSPQCRKSADMARYRQSLKTRQGGIMNGKA